MKRETVIITLIFLFAIFLLSGCITDSSDQSSDNGIPDGIYVCSSGEREFSSIQDAIDAATEGQTIFVFSGVYDERLTINKTINLMGEDMETTIIDGNNNGRVITITDEEFCTITGFTIQNSGSNVPAIDVKTSNNEISHNIIKNSYIGINSASVNYNSFHNNTLVSNSMYAIYISSRSDHNIVKNNVFEDNSYGMRIKGSRFNHIEKNDFSSNRRGMYYCCGATNNVGYHNNFVNNSVWSADDQVSGNTWFNDKTNQGNYWDDYTGIDEDNDGIGDTPYTIKADRVDPYPLMHPVD